MKQDRERGWAEQDEAGSILELGAAGVTSMPGLAPRQARAWQASNLCCLQTQPHRHPFSTGPALAACGLSVLLSPPSPMCCSPFVHTLMSVHAQWSMPDFLCRHPPYCLRWLSLCLELAFFSQTSSSSGTHLSPAFPTTAVQLRCALLYLGFKWVLGPELGSSRSDGKHVTH